MKKVLFSMVLLLVSGAMFAQEKAVKEAKSIANALNPDFKKAEQLINGALTNAETKDNAETWNVAGLIQSKRSAKEMENAYLKKPYDTLQVYNSALDMCKYYFKCDELAQIPNEKGKIKNKYRKPNSVAVMAERGNLINGGIQYFNMAMIDDEVKAKELNSKALEFFSTYIESALHPLMTAQNLLATDTVLPQIAYYASLAAAKVKDYKAIEKYAPYGVKDKEVGKYTLELLSTAQKELGQTDKWVATLQEGVQTYPDHDFFFANLIDYYTNSNKYEEAMQFADAMIAKEPNNSFYLYVKGYLYHSQYSGLKTEKKDDAAAAAVLEKAIEYYQKTVDIDNTNATVYSYLGLMYCLQAQDFSEKAATDVTDPKYKEDMATLKAFYEKAKPNYERARQLEPENTGLWLQGLYRVYYNLDMGDEFKEIESLM